MGDISSVIYKCSDTWRRFFSKFVKRRLEWVRLILEGVDVGEKTVRH
jgi:hypothetical protein